MRKLFLLIITFYSIADGYSQTAVEYFDQGVIKSKTEDNQGAIADFTKALVLNPNITNAYINRGCAKSYLSDYRGAIEDYTTFLKTNPEDAFAYYKRGQAKERLKDYMGAI
jgi:tetratricopeptide (TPR) repeat protein